VNETTRWQGFYDEDERVITAPTTHSARKAVEVFSQRAKRIILDLGCGTGRDTCYLAEKGLFVVGVDLAESGLAIAKRSRKNTTNWVHADARQLPFRNASFEGIYCFGLLHEFTGETRESDVRVVMSEVHRVLKSSGVLVLAVLSGESEKGLPHVYLFTEKTFDDATRRFQVVNKSEYCDIGCTGKEDYRIWYGTFTKS
jgi:ubiquinone/menaquinone biosynthesis C-methylase UbiE